MPMDKTELDPGALAKLKPLPGGVDKGEEAGPAPPPVVHARPSLAGFGLSCRLTLSGTCTKRHTHVSKTLAWSSSLKRGWQPRHWQCLMVARDWRIRDLFCMEMFRRFGRTKRRPVRPAAHFIHQMDGERVRLWKSLARKNAQVATDCRGRAKPHERPKILKALGAASVEFVGTTRERPGVRLGRSDLEGLRTDFGARRELDSAASHRVLGRKDAASRSRRRY